MATLTVNEIDDDGLVQTLAAASGGGDAVAVDIDGRNWLEINNASGGSITVTIAAAETARDVPGLGRIVIGNRAVAVGAGVRTAIPLRPYMADVNGLAQITYSGVTSLTIGAFRCKGA